MKVLSGTAGELPDSIASEAAEVNQIMEDINASHAKATPSLARFIVNSGQVLGWVVYDAQTGKDGVDGQDYMLSLMSTVGRREEGMEKKPCQYWCLLFRKTDNGTCRRIGVGKSYSHEWWRDAALQDVVLS